MIQHHPHDDENSVQKVDSHRADHSFTLSSPGIGYAVRQWLVLRLEGLSQRFLVLAKRVNKHNTSSVPEQPGDQAPEHWLAIVNQRAPHFVQYLHDDRDVQQRPQHIAPLHHWSDQYSGAAQWQQLSQRHGSGQYADKEPLQHHSHSTVSAQYADTEQSKSLSHYQAKAKKNTNTTKKTGIQKAITRLYMVTKHSLIQPWFRRKTPAQTVNNTINTTAQPGATMAKTTNNQQATATSFSKAKPGIIKSVISNDEASLRHLPLDTTPADNVSLNTDYAVVPPSKNMNVDVERHNVPADQQRQPEASPSASTSFAVKARSVAAHQHTVRQQNTRWSKSSVGHISETRGDCANTQDIKQAVIAESEPVAASQPLPLFRAHRSVDNGISGEATRAETEGAVVTTQPLSMRHWPVLPDEESVTGPAAPQRWPALPVDASDKSSAVLPVTLKRITNTKTDTEYRLWSG